MFGLETKPGRQLAHHLGRALQLTNILRDLDEDEEVGRLYLPQEDSVQHRTASTDPSAVVASPRLDRACAQLIEAARSHFAKAHQIMSLASPRTARGPRTLGQAPQNNVAPLPSAGTGAAHCGGIFPTFSGADGGPRIGAPASADSA